MGEVGQRFRSYSWMLFLVSGFMIFYSGLFFLGLLPMPEIHRYWEGGSTALVVAGLLDLISGGAVLLLVFIMLARGCFRSAGNSMKFLTYLDALAIFCILGIIGDLIGGLYAIGAQIGLYSCVIDWIITMRD